MNVTAEGDDVIVRDHLSQTVLKLHIPNPNNKLFKMSPKFSRFPFSTITSIDIRKTS